MKVTAIEEYGLRCMVLLARNWDNGSITLPEFAASENVSVPYAGKLMMILRKSGLVKAVRGRKGGYALARNPELIKLKEIFEVLGKPVFSADHCERFTGEKEICIHTEDCTVRGIWQVFEGFIGSFLEKVTLAELASGDSDFLKKSGLKIGFGA
jgi:Rrf2 family iron-sulfur cluster assembly transcriptional regulator